MFTAVIGGGFSGLVAAVYAKDHGSDVTVFEHNERVGKKILMTGNGRCNISNADMSIGHFHSEDPAKVQAVLDECGPDCTEEFFEKIGLYIKDRDGYKYPYSEQASAVLDVLRFAARDKGVNVITSAHVEKIEKKDRFEISCSKKKYYADRVIICTGSCAYPQTGSDGSGYEIAKSFGHSVNEPVPALTYLTCKEDFYPSVAGIRTSAHVAIYVEDHEGAIECGSDTGQLQFTKTGISGICVFNICHIASHALKNKKEVFVLIDLLPAVGFDEAKRFFVNRIENIEDRPLEEMFIGLLAKPLGICILKRCGLDIGKKCGSLSQNEINEIVDTVKKFKTVISSTGGFDSSQTVSGGVLLKEVNDSLESRLIPGLYFAGEILDVNGDCGGYNLQWAASSAMVAAKNACK